MKTDLDLPPQVQQMLHFFLIQNFPLYILNMFLKSVMKTDLDLR